MVFLQEEKNNPVARQRNGHARQRAPQRIVLVELPPHRLQLTGTHKPVPEGWSNGRSS